MDLPTQTHLTSLRDMLVYRQHELRTEIKTTEQTMLSDSQMAADEVTDRKDTAARYQQGELADAQERRDLDELELVESALQRLDQGVYGDCVGCGEPIVLSRLQVQPAAQRCAACQADFEHASTQARPAARR
ncbi:MAG: TraR/DksA C4-type zinc finger protein [Burkholderiaceae bacterium]